MGLMQVWKLHCCQIHWPVSLAQQLSGRLSLIPEKAGMDPLGSGLPHQ